MTIEQLQNYPDRSRIWDDLCRVTAIILMAEDEPNPISASATAMRVNALAYAGRIRDVVMAQPCEHDWMLSPIAGKATHVTCRLCADVKRI